MKFELRAPHGGMFFINDDFKNDFFKGLTKVYRKTNWLHFVY